MENYLLFDDLFIFLADIVSRPEPALGLMAYARNDCEKSGYRGF